MDYITNKTVLIGVGIFVTLIIVTMVLLVFNEMKGVYNVVAKTETDIYTQFNNIVSMYDNAKMNGVELVNTIKKYESEIRKEDQDNTKLVDVKYPGVDTVRRAARLEGIREAEYLKQKMEENIKLEGISYRYENQYNVYVEKDEKGITIIIFVLNKK